MQVLAVFVITLAKLLIEVADWHLAHVILMEKFAVITFLAQVTQPVLADDSALSSNMAKRAVAPSTASAIQKKLTQGSLVLCERRKTRVYDNSEQGVLYMHEKVYILQLQTYPRKNHPNS